MPNPNTITFKILLIIDNWSITFLRKLIIHHQ